MSRSVKLMIAILTVVGAGAFVLAAVVSDDSPGNVSISGNDAIEAIIPAEGAEVLQQQSVGVDLSPPYRVTSMIIAPTDDRSSGVDVTTQVDEMGGLNQFVFSPAEGKLIEALSPDTNCVFVVYVEISRPNDPATVDWCFEVT